VVFLAGEAHPFGWLDTPSLSRHKWEAHNFDCYSSAIKGECDQADCTWRSDCFDAAAHDMYPQFIDF
jgi:hypothetical protein